MKIDNGVGRLISPYFYINVCCLPILPKLFLLTPTALLLLLLRPLLLVHYFTAYLMVDYNDLTGTIPSELGNLDQLSGWLSLEGNQLHGTIPSSFARLTNATWIYLNGNELTGSADFLCEALQPVEGPGYTNENSTSPLLELWVDHTEVTCKCCNCCPMFD